MCRSRGLSASANCSSLSSSPGVGGWYSFLSTRTRMRWIPAAPRVLIPAQGYPPGSVTTGHTDKLGLKSVLLSCIRKGWGFPNGFFDCPKPQNLMFASGIMPVYRVLSVCVCTCACSPALVSVCRHMYLACRMYTISDILEIIALD